VRFFGALVRLFGELDFRALALPDIAGRRAELSVCEARVFEPLAAVWRTTPINSSGKSDANVFASLTASFACRAK
jgi:hypothetical protein